MALVKYCIICPKYQVEETSAGLLHQASVLAGLWNECKEKGLIPIRPNLILTAGHNKGIQKLLLDYIDLPIEFVNSKPENAIVEIYTPFKFFPCIAKTLRTHFPFKQYFKDRAKKIVAKMPKPICCVRVRRTDMLIARPETNISIQAIKNVLAKYNYNSLYLMTDEKDKNFFNEIEKKYQAFNFPELAKLTDNYELFAIECCMRDLCDIRIGMFSSNDDNEYYHDSLTSILGIH